MKAAAVAEKTNTRVNYNICICGENVTIESRSSNHITAHLIN